MIETGEYKHMNTVYLTITDLQAQQEEIACAGQILREGGLVAIPTETVYGLGANALDGRAVRKIFEAKGRPQDNPLIVHIADLEQLAPLIKQIPPSAKLLAEHFWPGPLTMIFEKADCIPPETSGGLDTVAVRFPSHPVAQAVIRAAGVPVAAPSANLSGKPSPTTARHVREDMDGKIEMVVDGGECSVGLESTVITLVGEHPVLLRPGGVTLEQIRALLPDAQMDPAVEHKLEEGRRAASPGMKYKHYAPLARVILVEGSREQYIGYVNSKAGEDVWALCFAEDEDKLKVPALCYGREEDDLAQAKHLFDALRRFDELGAKTVYAHCPQRTGVGLAVYNRLVRAAGFTIVRLPR